MKKIGLGCAVTITAIAIFIGIIFFATSGVAGAADQFVAHLAAKETDQAYALLGPEVVNDLPRDKFEDWLKATKLDQTKSGSWSSRNVDNGEGEIKGDLTLADGTEKPIIFILAKFDGEWKIQGIQFEDKESTDEDTSSAESAVKARSELFLERLRNDQLKEAYGMVGEALRADLDEAAFGPFVKQSGLASAIATEWKETEVNGAEAKIVAVVTLADEKHLNVTLILMKEEGDWLVGGINLKPIEGLTELPAPTDEEAVELATKLQNGLATYVDTQDDSKLMEICHTTLRFKLEDKEKGLPAFVKSFPDQQSFRELLDLKPQLVESPQKDKKYGASVKTKTAPLANGKFLTTELELGVEDNRWKFTSFQVNTRLP